MTMTERTYARLRTFSIKIVEHYERDPSGAMTRTLTAEDFDLPVDRAELEALHELLGQILGPHECSCYVWGRDAGFDDARETVDDWHEPSRNEGFD